MQRRSRDCQKCLAECLVLRRVGDFQVRNPEQRAAAIVKATTFYDDPDVLAKVSRGLGEAMVGINVDEIPVPHRLAARGW